MKPRWEQTTLGEVVSFKGGGTPSTEKPSYWNGDIPWISPKDMKSSEVSNSIDKITPEAIENSAASLIPKDAILIVVRSGILARTIPVGITTRPLSVNQDIKALCPGKDIDPRYLHYFMQASEPNILKLVTRGATVHRLSTDSLRALKFPKPPLAEQQRIVAILDEAFAGVATATANAKKNLKNARELFKSALNSIFANKGDDWTTSTIGEAVESGLIVAPQDGNHGEIHPKKSDYVADGVPFIMASDLQDGEVNCVDCNFISDKTAAGLRKGFAKDGDVLLSHKGTIGRVAVLETGRPFVVLTPQVTYYRVKNSEIISNQFLRFVFESAAFQSEMAQIAGAGSTRAYIGITKQLELVISYPSLSDQVGLVSVLATMKQASYDLENVYRRKLQSVADLKQSILQKAFSGELTSPPSRAIKEAAE